MIGFVVLVVIQGSYERFLLSSTDRTVFDKIENVRFPIFNASLRKFDAAKQPTFFEIADSVKSVSSET